MFQIYGEGLEFRDLGTRFRDMGLSGLSQVMDLVLNHLSQAWLDAESYKFSRMPWFVQDVAMDPPLEHEAPLELPADQLPVQPVVAPRHQEPEHHDATEDCMFHCFSLYVWWVV